MNLRQPGRWWLPVVLLLVVGLNPTTDSTAHEIRPALLDITERDPGWFDVTWKVPTRGNLVLGLKPILPNGLTPVAPPSRYSTPGARLEHSSFKSDGRSLIGETISIEGLSTTYTDVLLRITLIDGSTHSAILRPGSPEFTIPPRETKATVAWSYLKMGTTHILSGIDHLLFVLALVLIVPNYWMLFKTITAFTVAHSITLGLAALGFVHVPPGPTEAVIALSIVFLAGEIIHSRQGRFSLAERYPWIVAFIFGLFHGLGFAGALTQVGLPGQEIPLALLMFNVGVELGQILFLSGILSVMATLRWVRISWPAGTWRLAPYAIGSVSAFWTIQRVASFF